MWEGINALRVKQNFSWNKLRGANTNLGIILFCRFYYEWKTKLHSVAMKIHIPTMSNYQNAIFIYTFMIIHAIYSPWHDCVSHLFLYEKLLFNHKTQLRYYFFLEALVEFSASLCFVSIFYIGWLEPWLCCNILQHVSLPNLNMNSLKAGYMFLIFFIAHHSAYVWISDFKNVWVNEYMNELTFCLLANQISRVYISS